MKTEFSRPYIVSWNLTYRCNLACEHCYLDAGAKKFHKDESPAFADRSEMSTIDCFKVIDQLKDFAPESVTILTGGEPLMRKDILKIINYANQSGLWTVVGTNGVLITEHLGKLLKDNGVRGMALSLDSLDPDGHDRFRRVKGAWMNTVKGSRILNKLDLPFIVQTTVAQHNIHELIDIARFAYTKMQAKVLNLYFLVPSGRGAFVSDISDEEYNSVLNNIYKLQKEFDGKMLINAKCAPHYTKTLFSKDPNSKFLKQFAGQAGGCPAGTHYMGIRPNGDVTPCPYLPLFAGNLRDIKLANIWNDSQLFNEIRQRKSLGGRCGSCEFNSTCGGCRARAYGESGKLLAEDPLCNHQPQSISSEMIVFEQGSEYGIPEKTIGNDDNISWDDEALARMQAVPAFVRGMVKKRVANFCQKEGITRVTAEVLQDIRGKMPASTIFRGS